MRIAVKKRYVIAMSCRPLQGSDLAIPQGFQNFREIATPLRPQARFGAQPPVGRLLARRCVRTGSP